MNYVSKKKLIKPKSKSAYVCPFIKYPAFVPGPLTRKKSALVEKFHISSFLVKFHEIIKVSSSSRLFQKHMIMIF